MDLKEQISKMMVVTESMNELDMVTDMNADANSFLADVKARVPDIYARVYSVFKNRGLDAAKELFSQYDPVVIKQKEKERKSAETRDRAKAKITDMRSFMLGKEELADMIERIVLTEDYRMACQRLNFPQLVSSNFVPKTRINQHELSVGFTITSKVSYSPGIEGLKKFSSDIKRNDTDAILDDILKLSKGFARDQKFQRLAKKGGYYYGDEEDNWWEISRNVIMYNKLRMSYTVDNWGGRANIIAGGDNESKISIVGDEVDIIKTKSAYESMRLSTSELTRELVVGVIEKMLVKLHTSIMDEIKKLERHNNAIDIMRKGEENPGLNEDDVDEATKDVSTKNLSNERTMMAKILRDEMNSKGVSDKQILDFLFKNLKGTELYFRMAAAFEDLVHERPELYSNDFTYINQLDRIKNRTNE